MSGKEPWVRVYALDELDAIACEIYQNLDGASVLAFEGTLGAGKTTLVQAILRCAGVTGPIASPTFTYVHHYQIPSGKTFYHFDLYRIPTLESFLEAGFAEYLYQPNSFALIEWPEVITPLLKYRVCWINLDYEGTEKRRITAHC